MIQILPGDVVDQLRTLPDASVQCVVTSPPYWGLRDYGTGKWEGGDPDCKHNPQKPDGGERSDRTLPLGRGGMYKDICGICGAIRVDNQIGLEKTPEEYTQKMVEVFREVWRVLRDDGTVWLNLGDSYASGKGTCYNPGGGEKSLGQERKERGCHPLDRGNISDLKESGLKPKDLVGIPWRVAFALQADGWYLRSDIIWSKPNPMPESVTDRPTKAHEYLFLLTKNARYYYDADAIREDGVQYEIERRTREYNQGLNTKHVISSDGKTGQSPQSEHGCVKDLKARQELIMTGKRNRRTVWEIATQPTPDAHFATFPEALVEPCIKAGTSERGCCLVCGAPWERVVEKGLTAHDGETESQYKINTTANRLALLRQAARERGEEYSSEKKTLGWQPTCSCGNEDTVPCMVLDPFGGSGTTAKVARELKRDCILIELNPGYVKIARNKLRLNEQLVIPE